MIFLKCNRVHVDPDGNCARRMMSPTIGMNGGRICHENEAASLLLSMSGIVSDEIKNNACLLDDLSSDEALILQSKRTQLVVPEGITQCDDSDGQFTWNRVRTVSMDASSVNSNSGHQGSNLPTKKHEKRSNRVLRKAKGRLTDNGDLKKSVHSNVGRRKSFKKILRKKFSWKNYPGKHKPVPCHIALPLRLTDSSILVTV